MNRLLCLIVIAAVLRTGMAQSEPPSAAIPERAEVEIELLENLSSETLHDGQQVSFRVVRPVEVSGKTVIAAGAPVSGEVKQVKRSGAWRKAGAFNLVLSSVKLTDGSTARLDFQRPQLRGTKGEKAGEIIGTGAALTYYFPLIPVALITGAKKGKPYNIRAGERYLVYVVSSEPPAGAGAAERTEDPGERTKESKTPKQ